MKTLNAWKFLLMFCLAATIATVAVSSVTAGTPTGGSPNDPLMVPTDWTNIASGKMVWYYFDYATDSGGGVGGPGGPGRPGSTNRSKVDVVLDANGVSGLAFAIYTPVQATDWLRDQTTSPVGRGTPYRNTSSGDITHDLYWSGAFNSTGRYFVAVTNSTASQISFRLTITGETVTLYPIVVPTPTPTIAVPFTAKVAPTGTIQGKIVFQTSTGGAIYTVNGDGTNLTLLTNGLDPSWSSDGKQVTFARWGGAYAGLYVSNADGSKEQLVYGAQRVRSPKWSADGKYIVFVQDKTTNERDPKWKLGLIELNKSVDAETKKNALTEPQCSSLCYAPSWSNDNATVIFADPNIGIMTTSIISGSASVTVGATGSYYDTAANVIRPILHMPPIQSAEVSPDGKRIVYAQQAHDRWEVNLVNVDGSNSTAVTSPDPIMYTFYNQTVHNVAPTWSPDGKQILFLSDRNGKWEFFTCDPDGSNVRQVLKNVTDLVSIRFDYENERVMDWTK
jgi:hypothetical protein